MTTPRSPHSHFIPFTLVIVVIVIDRWLISQTLLCSHFARKLHLGVDSQFRATSVFLPTLENGSRPEDPTNEAQEVKAPRGGSDRHSGRFDVFFRPRLHQCRAEDEFEAFHSASGLLDQRSETPPCLEPLKHSHGVHVGKHMYEGEVRWYHEVAAGIAGHEHTLP